MNLQKSFFERIRKEHLSDNENLAREIAKFLHVSETSAYRRINGQTPLTFDELQRLAKYYRVSIDEHIGLSMVGHSQLAFSWQSGFDHENAYQDFLNWLLRDLEQTTETQGRIIFHAKDFPVFFNFVYPEIGAFKSFFWQKALMRLPRFKSSSFSCENLPTDHLELGKRIFRRYAALDSMELWNDDVLNSVLKQIRYCHEVKFLSSKEDTVRLLSRLKDLVLLMRDMAEAGRKFLPGEPSSEGGKFELYHNEVILGDNSILLEEGSSKRIYLSQNIIQGLITSEPAFVENSFRMKTNLFKNSLLLSNSAEKERMNFFGSLLDKINEVHESLNLIS